MILGINRCLCAVSVARTMRPTADRWTRINPHCIKPCLWVQHKRFTSVYIVQCAVVGEDEDRVVVGFRLDARSRNMQSLPAKWIHWVRRRFARTQNAGDRISLVAVARSTHSQANSIFIFCFEIILWILGARPERRRGEEFLWSIWMRKIG